MPPKSSYRAAAAAAKAAAAAAAAAVVVAPLSPLSDAGIRKVGWGRGVPLSLLNLW